jgi:hypothetical protein
MVKIYDFGQKVVQREPTMIASIAKYRAALAVKLLALALALYLGSMPLNSASAMTVEWQNATSAGGDFGSTNSFDNAFITFPGFISSELLSVIPYSGAGYFHTHNPPNPQTMFLDLQLDGVWTQVFEASTTSDTRIETNKLSSIVMNIVFPESTVTGIRLRSLLPQGPGTLAFHDMRDSLGNLTQGELFVFATPLPAALPLFLTALGALGLVGWRRRRAA